MAETCSSHEQQQQSLEDLKHSLRRTENHVSKHRGQWTILLLILGTAAAVLMFNVREMNARQKAIADDMMEVKLSVTANIAVTNEKLSAIVLDRAELKRTLQNHAERLRELERVR